MKKKTKSIGLILLILLIFLLGAGIFVLGLDEPPPFTADVELSLPPLSPHSFQERLRRGELQVPQEPLRKADDLARAAYNANGSLNMQDAHKVWGAGKMDEALAGIPPEFWVNLDSLLQAPPDRSRNTGSILTTLSSVRIIKYRALRLAQQGKADDGLRMASKIPLLGKKYCESSCSLAELLGGLAIRAIGYTTMGEIAGNYSVSPSCLREMQEVVRQSHVSNDTMRDNIKSDYSHGRRLFFDQGLTDIKQLQSMMVSGDSFAGHFLAIPHTSNFCPQALLIKPNETLRIYTEWIRTTLAWPYLDSNGLNKIAFDQEAAVLKYTDGHFPYDPYNDGGRVMISIVVLGFRDVLLRRLTIESQASALEAMLAVREYELQHGTLPESLEKLVPGYLPAIPLDFADDAPIRYSPRSRAIWSIGKKCDLVEPLPKPEEDDVRNEHIFRLPPLPGK